MSKLSIYDSKTMIKILTTVILCHNEDLTIGLIRKILKYINISIEEYERLKYSFIKSIP